MSHISLANATAWTETTKVGANFTSLDATLESQISTQIIQKLAARFDTTLWIDATVTPALVQSIIAMYYVAWVYDRQYSTDENISAYAALLRSQADINIEGLLSGAIDLPEDPAGDAFGYPSFFPTDASSANEPSAAFPNDGPPVFTMGAVW